MCAHSEVHRLPMESKDRDDEAVQPHYLTNNIVEYSDDTCSSEQIYQFISRMKMTRMAENIHLLQCGHEHNSGSSIIQEEETDRWRPLSLICAVSGHVVHMSNFCSQPGSVSRRTSDHNICLELLFAELFILQTK